MCTQPDVRRCDVYSNTQTHTYTTTPDTANLMIAYKYKNLIGTVTSQYYNGRTTNGAASGIENDSVYGKFTNDSLNSNK